MIHLDTNHLIEVLVSGTAAEDGEYDESERRSIAGVQPAGARSDY